jgi:hypothetical protein
MKVIHGIAIQEEHSYMLDAETALTGFAEAGNPGTYLVDVFPSMKLIPQWFPGAGWKRRAAFLRGKNSILVNYPWNLVKDRTASVLNFSKPSIMIFKNFCVESG